MLNGWNTFTAELKKHIQLLHFINKTSKENVHLSVKMLNGIGKAITEMDESDMPRNPTDKAFPDPINRFDSPINYLDKGSTEIGYRNMEIVINQGLTGRQINLLAGSYDEQSALPCSAHFIESTGRTPYLPAFCLRFFFTISPYFQANRINNFLLWHFKPEIHNNHVSLIGLKRNKPKNHNNAGRNGQSKCEYAA